MMEFEQTETEQSTVENTQHDYEPGEATQPMFTDPLCRICGQSKGAKVHGE